MGCTSGERCFHASCVKHFESSPQSWGEPNYKISGYNKIFIIGDYKMELKTKILILPLLTTIIASIGSINWGLIGLFELNLVEFIFGRFPILVKIIYVLVGISGILLFLKVKD